MVGIEKLVLVNPGPEGSSAFKEKKMAKAKKNWTKAERVAFAKRMQEAKAAKAQGKSSAKTNPGTKPRTNSGKKPTRKNPATPRTNASSKGKIKRNKGTVGTFGKWNLVKIVENVGLVGVTYGVVRIGTSYLSQMTVSGKTISQHLKGWDGLAGAALGITAAHFATDKIKPLRKFRTPIMFATIAVAAEQLLRLVGVYVTPSNAELGNMLNPPAAGQMLLGTGNQQQAPVAGVSGLGRQQLTAGNNNRQLANTSSYDYAQRVRQREQARRLNATASAASNAASRPLPGDIFL